MLRGRARNLGTSIARGELLAFLAADTIPASGWLDELERSLVPGVEMVAGAILDGTPNGVARHGPRLAAGLVAWGLGVWQPSGNA